MKKQLFLFLLMLLPMVAGADELVKIDGIYYNLNPDTSEAEVTNSLGGLNNAPRSYEGYVTIPSMFSYYGKTYKVTRIGRYAFRDCQEMYSVTIGDNVKVIEMGAFENCTSLFIVTIPDGVEVIRESAFTRCFFRALPSRRACPSSARMHSYTAIILTKCILQT